MAQAKTEKGAGGHKPVGTDISTARRVGRLRRHNRLRKRVAGTPERPRLGGQAQLTAIHVQLVDDTVGRTLANASTMDAACGAPRATSPPWPAGGTMIAERAKAPDLRGRLRPWREPVRRANRRPGRRRPRGWLDF